MTKNKKTEKPEIPNNMLTRTVYGFLSFTQGLHNRGKVGQSEKEVYFGDLTNRMFAFATDLFIIVAPFTILTNIIIAVFLQGYQYDITIAKIHNTVSPEVFASLSKDAFSMNQYIMQNYPSDAETIIHQLIYVRVCQLIMLGVYVIFFTYKFGGTPGKLILGLKVVDNITGGKLSLSQSVIRYLAYFITVPFGLMSGGFRKDKRCWHDFVADTVVIYTPDRWYKKGFEKVKSSFKNYFNLK